VQKKGITIRKTIDCLIAQTAIDHQLILLHHDNDFDKIASASDLRVYWSYNKDPETHGLPPLR